MGLDSKFMKKAIVLIAFAILFMWFLENIVVVFSVIKTLFSIISPFLWGLVLAFLLSGPMRFFEKRIPWNKGILSKSSPGARRGIAYLMTLLLFILILSLISFIIIPELINTLQDIINKSSTYVEKIQNFVTTFIMNNRQSMDWAKFIEFDWEQFKASSIEFTKNSLISALQSTLNFSISIASGTIDFALAFVFSIYVLFQKEKLARQMKKLIVALCPSKASEKIFYIADLSNTTFSNFLHGQLLEAIILGSLFFIAMTIFGFPYPLMISVTIAVTSIIPIFGAFIGAFVGAILILVIDYKMAFWFVIMFLVIQQIEGNLIYPHVVGKASGLPSMWILVAVTVGGSLLGVLGILLFIPVFSILYTLLGEYVNNRLREKNMLE